MDEATGPMTAGEVRAARERLVQAKADLPDAADRVELLGALLDRLRDPTSEPHQKLVARLPAASGFSPEVVREGLRLALADWTGEALLALARRELGPDLGVRGARRLAPFETVTVVLGGALPMPTVIEMLGPLVVGSPALVKPASRDPLTARVVADSLAEVSPELGRAVEIASVRSDDGQAMAALCQAPCVVASGSDATMGALREHLPATTRFVPHGHRLSVAVLDARARGDALARDAAGLATDVCLWDQLGCLSPAFALVVGEPTVPDAVWGAVGDALDARAAALPRGRVAPATAAVLAHERQEAQMRADANADVRVREGNDFVLVAEADARLRPLPGHRLLRLLPAPGEGELARALADVAPHLAAVGIAASMEPVVRALLARSGASRLCPLGRMQAPPLSWSHDGQPVFLPLARWVDLEGPGAD